jgi:hypothetical protein|eukprot:COSAG02_NODE_6898_length_3299_cov_42.741563_3_plen_43_part_00
MAGSRFARQLNSTSILYVDNLRHVAQSRAMADAMKAMIDTAL